MSKLPPLKRLVLEDLPSEVQEWAPKLIEPLNQFMAAVSGGLDRKLTLADNCVAQFRTLTITISGDSGGRDTTSGSGTTDALAKWTGADTLGEASAADVLAVVKTVDGSGSGLDADMLDGQHASAFAPKASPAFTGNGTIAGNLGVGSAATPVYLLDLGTSLANTKLALYSGGTSIYGFGIQSSLFRLNLGHSGARFGFFDDEAGNEIMSLAGNGDLTITRRLLAAGISGKATIGSGNTSVTVSNSLCTATSVVIVTPTGSIGPSGTWWVEPAAGSFAIHMTPSQIPATNFSYLIVED